MNDEVLEQLLNSYVDNELSEEQESKLATWLREDDEHRLHFILRMYQLRLLRERFIEEHAVASIEEAKALDNWQVQQRWFARATYLARPTAVSITVAALFIGLMITAMAFIAAPFYRQLAGSDDGHAGGDLELVARVTGMQDAHWAEGQVGALRGAQLPAGHRIELVSGLAEITYESGATVLLEGPATYTINAKNSGSLNVGKLTARVPERAVGFEIHTPVGSIVDLGTEFGVLVVKEGHSDFHVFEGRAEVRPRVQNDSLAKIELKAGQAVKVAATTKQDGKPIVQSIVAQEDEFARTIWDAQRPGWLVVKNMTTGRLLFADNFERSDKVSHKNAGDPDGPYLPDNGGLPGQWSVGEGSQMAVQVTDSQHSPDPGAIQGRRYLRFARRGPNSGMETYADLEAVFDNVQSTPGDVLHFEGMFFIPADADQAVVQILYREGMGTQPSVNVYADGEGAVLYLDSTPGLTIDERGKPAGLKYRPNTWQKWELDYAVGSREARVGVDGKYAAFPVVDPVPAISSLGLRVGKPPERFTPYYVDAVPLEGFPNGIQTASP